MEPRIGADRLRLAVLALAVLVAAWIGIAAAIPPRVVPASAPAAAFSADRAMADVRTIAARPHVSGSASLLHVRETVEARLRSLGIDPEERRYMIDPDGLETLRRWNPKAIAGGELVDVVGVLPGKDRLKPAVALMAHLDTVWGSPGAGDDTIGVASILEILRAIKAQGTPERDIVVLLTDGEEIGLLGAKAFWPTDGLADHVGAVINLEARGAGGRATMFETGEANGAMMALFGASVRHPVANSMAVMAYRLMPNSTDFTVSSDRGLPGFNFAIMGRAAYYHSPRATIDRLDPRSLQDMGDQALDLVSALVSAKALPGDAPDVVFFDVAGHGLLSYGTAGGWLVLLIAAGGLAAAWTGARRAGQVSVGEVAYGGLAFLWLAALAGLLIGVLNLISGSAHGNYYDRLAALPRLEVQALLAAFAATIGWLGLRRAPVRALGVVAPLVLGLLGWALGGGFLLVLLAMVVAMLGGWFAPAGGVTRWGGWLGAIGLLLLAATIAQIEAPMAAWLLAWPAMIAALAAAVAAWGDVRFDRGLGWGIVGIALVLILAPALPLAHLAFLGIGGPMPETMLGVLLPVAMAAWPLARIERRAGWAGAFAGLLLIFATATALHIRTDPIAATIPAYSLDK